MNDTSHKLLENSKSLQFACIEIHNKPIFPFRYEVCVILNIAAWELLFKAFIIEFRSTVKVINEDGTTKPFEECLRFIASELGNDFLVTKENIDKIYEYRCNIIHFYQDEVDILVFSLLSKNILLYHEFLLKHFNIDIASDTNLVLLPIGFKKPTSPVDFLSNESLIQKSSAAVQSFVKSIIQSTDNISKVGIEDSILYSFKMSLINESRIKNADVIAAITKDKSEGTILVDNVIGKIVIADENEPGAKKIRIEEESLFKTIYTQTYDDIIRTCKERFSDFKQNSEFYRILSDLKNRSDLHKIRFLNVATDSGGAKDYYSPKIYDEFAKHYKSK